MSFITFRKPDDNIRRFEIVPYRPRSRIDKWLVAGVYLVMLFVFYKFGLEYYGEKGEPVDWLTLGIAYLIFGGAVGLLAWVVGLLQKRIERSVERRQFAWIDETGVVLWVGFTGVRIPFQRIERVERLTPENAPRFWKLLIPPEDVTGVRFHYRGGLMSKGGGYVFVKDVDGFLAELRRKVESRPERVEFLSE